MHSSKVVMLTLLLGACGGSSRHSTTANLPTGRRPASLSKYLRLTEDVAASTTAQITLLSTETQFSQPVRVLLCSDGRVFPWGGLGRASLQLYVDGKPVGNESAIDWSESSSPQQHSYNAVAAVPLDIGPHTFQLRAAAGPYKIGMDSNLSVFVDPALIVLSSEPSGSHGPFDFDTSAMLPPSQCADAFRQDHYVALPHSHMAVVHVAGLDGPTYLLGAGTSKVVDNAGDAMFGLFMDGQPPWSPNMAFGAQHYAQYTVNDLFSGAEFEAPMYCQGVHAPDLWGPGTGGTFSLVASEFPFCLDGDPQSSNPVQYTVGGTATLVALHGGIRVHGHTGTDLPTHTSNEYFCVGGMDASTGCPPGGPLVITQSPVEIPKDHSGIVFFSGRARCQGGTGDAGGTVKLWIEIDGVPMSSVGVQGLGGSGASVSQRTLTASYLATGNDALTPGIHHVSLVVKVTGSFSRLSIHNEHPLLMWFD